jgi:hypothetical protein
MLGFRSKGITLGLVMIKQASTGGSSSKTEQFMALAGQAWTALSTAAVGATTTPIQDVTDCSKFHRNWAVGSLRMIRKRRAWNLLRTLSGNRNGLKRKWATYLVRASATDDIRS